MSSGVVALLSISALALLLVPRRWAPLPFITAACYLSVNQIIEIGPFHFTVVRILIAVGIVRVVLRGERLVGGINGLDRWIALFAVWACVSTLFQPEPGRDLIFRMGLAYNATGIYFLVRAWSTSVDDVIRLTQATAFLLVPVGIEMLYETTGSPSLFYVFEQTKIDVAVREGRIRALGPFLHPILAGTIGAVCLPLMIGIWRHRRRTAFAGIVACLLIVFTSASSGPVVSALAGVGALLLWPYRSRTKAFQWLVVVTYLLLSLVMKAPVYYLMARIDLAGGSTGWHRAKVIESALTYIGDWWLSGTDYTRHWTPVVGWTANHTDITNHYLYIGVLGGLPLMLLFIASLAKGFGLVGQQIRPSTKLSVDNQFMLWTLGASLFAHAVTFISVSYFDQSFVFLYLILAAIGSARANAEEPVCVPEAAAALPHMHAGRVRPRNLAREMSVPNGRPKLEPYHARRREA